MSRLTARSVAKYLIARAAQEGHPLTNMDVLKLLYYAQGWFLSLYDQPLFDEELEAWPDGPVQKAIYGEYKSYGYSQIADIPEVPTLPEPIKDHLNHIVSVFGVCGGPMLRAMTHSEDPWLNTRGDLSPDERSSRVIQKEDIQDYFSELIRGRPVDPKFEWAREALLARADEVERRFQDALAWVDEHYGEALQRLAE